MTSEVLLMNFGAVAFASDSAVTIDDEGTIRTQTQYQKIFRLDDGQSIAALTYGLAEFGGAPWPNVFETFKIQRNGAPVRKISGLVAELVDFLAAARPAESDANIRLPMRPNWEWTNLLYYVGYALMHLEWLAEQFVKAGGGNARDAFPRALAALRYQASTRGQYIGSAFFEFSPGGMRPRVGETTSRLSAFLHAHLDEIVVRVMRSSRGFLRNFPADLRGEFEEVIIQSMVTDWLPPDLTRAGLLTGLVLAGFASGEAQPSFEHVRVFGSIGGILKYAREEAGGPSQTGDTLIVRSFAQDDAITAYLQGARTDFLFLSHSIIMDLLARTLNDLMRCVVAKPRQQADVEKFRNMAMLVPGFGLYQARNTWGHHVKGSLAKILGACSAEPLGKHAERLLQLEILEHELMGEPTVARPISVLAMEKNRVVPWHST
jgi:hypothetical protein